MQKPKNRNGRPASALKAAMAEWRAKRAAMAAVPRDAPNSVFVPAMQAMCDAERAFVYVPARDLQDLRLKLEAGWYVNAEDPEGWEDYLEAMTPDIRRLAGPMSGGNRAALSSLKAASRRPPRDPNAPPSRSELVWAVHQMRDLLGDEWHGGALPGGTRDASEEQLRTAVAGAPVPAIVYRPHDDPNDDPDDWEEQMAWCFLLRHADEVPTIPWPAWILSAAGAEEAVAA